MKRILHKNGYPPDKQEQAEALSQEWAVVGVTTESLLAIEIPGELGAA